MAVTKKTGTVKATPKKAAPKKSTVKQATSKNVTKKNVKSTSLVIKIPKGGQIIRSFNLTPSLPVDGKATNWLLIDPEQPLRDIDSIGFSFNQESSALEQQFERAIVEINITQNPGNNGIWRFASDGVTVNPDFSDVDHDVVIEITNQGFTLIAQIQLIGDLPEEIRFGYLAAFTDAVSGAVSVYESQDPDIRVGRP